MLARSLARNETKRSGEMRESLTRAIATNRLAHGSRDLSIHVPLAPRAFVAPVLSARYSARTFYKVVGTRRESAPRDEETHGRAENSGVVGFVRASLFLFLFPLSLLLSPPPLLLVVVSSCFSPSRATRVLRLCYSLYLPTVLASPSRSNAGAHLTRRRRRRRRWRRRRRRRRQQQRRRRQQRRLRRH